jgi:uroporphyrin-III C-methyltransferase/precorrin-2 dehydrogenase/sirohydrochlorin ferrochelatase
MQLLPVFLKLAGRQVLLVGAGPVATSKLGSLLEAGARVRVVAPDVTDEIASAGVQIDRRPFRDDDVDGVWLVVAAATPDVNLAVARAAESRCVFVNAVDDPLPASAYLGGVLRRDGVTVAISTDGHAPAIAGLLREGLDAMLPRDLDRWMATAEEMRTRWRATGVPMEARRPELLEALVRLYDGRRSGSTEPVTR